MNDAQMRDAPGHRLRDHRIHVVASAKGYCDRASYCREIRGSDTTRREGSAQLTRSALHLLFRHPALLDDRGRQELNELLEQFEVLRVVIEFRGRLQHTWDGISASHECALEQLRALCAYADDSGISALRRFAHRLPTYVPAHTPA